MPHPNEYDQPAEGGRDVVENTLRKQKDRDSKTQQKSKPDNNPADPSKTQPKSNTR